VNLLVNKFDSERPAHFEMHLLLVCVRPGLCLAPLKLRPNGAVQICYYYYYYYYYYYSSCLSHKLMSQNYSWTGALTS